MNLIILSNHIISNFKSMQSSFFSITVTLLCMRFEEFQQIQVGTKIVHKSYIEKSPQNIFLSPESQIRLEPSSGCCNVTRRLHILFL